MSLLKTEILSLNPPLYWTGEDAFGTNHLTNQGTVGAPGNAAINGDPTLGVISLTADGGETSIFQSGNQAAEGWTAGHQASVQIGAADPFTIFAAFQALSVPTRSVFLVAQGQVNAFGGMSLQSTPSGVIQATISDVNAHITNLIAPPLVTDNTRRIASFVRSTSTGRLLLYVDGALILNVPDVTAGNVVSQAGSVNVVGNRQNLDLGWVGMLGHAFITKTEIGGIEQAVLFNKYWNGTPPPAPFSAQQIIVAGATLDLTDIPLILQSVRRTFP
jgi:hypothetical protein